MPGAAQVYVYRFDWQTPIYDGKLYSPHTIEIPFVFDNVTTKAGKVMTGGGDKTAALARTVSSAWVEFARSGKPVAPGFPAWPIHSTQRRASIHINMSSRVGQYMNPVMVKLFHGRLWAKAGFG